MPWIFGHLPGTSVWFSTCLNHGLTKESPRVYGFLLLIEPGYDDYTPGDLKLALGCQTSGFSCVTARPVSSI